MTIPPTAETSGCAPGPEGSGSRSTVREVHTGRDFRVRYYFCGCGPDDPPYSEVHEETCIGAVLSGFFSYRTDHFTCALSPGAVLLGNRGHAYQCSHEHSQGDVSLVFAVDESMLATVLDCAKSSASDAEFSLPCLPAAPDLSITIGRAQAAAEAADAFWLEEIAYELVAAALMPSCEQPAEEHAPSFKDLERASEVIHFIDDNFASPLSLAQLADVAGVSPFHFLRLFRTVTGNTPYRYLMQLRLGEAAMRLLRTDRPITDIAFEVGFGDLSQFIRTFRAASGLTPGAFRTAYS
jgi:AraC-like DNA-binding protein